MAQRPSHLDMLLGERVRLNSGYIRVTAPATSKPHTSVRKAQAAKMNPMHRPADFPHDRAGPAQASSRLAARLRRTKTAHGAVRAEKSGLVTA